MHPLKQLRRENRHSLRKNFTIGIFVETDEQRISGDDRGRSKVSGRPEQHGHQRLPVPRAAPGESLHVRPFGHDDRARLRQKLQRRVPSEFPGRALCLCDGNVMLRKEPLRPAA